MKFKSFKEYVNKKGKLVKPREELKADYHDSIPKAPKGHKAPYVGKGIKVKGNQGLGDVGDKNMVWEPDTEVPSSKKKIVDVLDEQVAGVGIPGIGSGPPLTTKRDVNIQTQGKAAQLDKQIYAKYPKGSTVDGATAKLIFKMYKDAGLDEMDAPPVGSDDEFVIEQRSIGHGHSADPEFLKLLHSKIIEVMHDHKGADIVNVLSSELEEEPEEIRELILKHFPDLAEELGIEEDEDDFDYDRHSPRSDDELAHARQSAGGWDDGVDESAFGKYVESKDAFKMMQDHPGKSCKKAHKGKTHEEWKKSKKSDDGESKDDKEESKDDKGKSKDDKGKSKFDMMKDHPFKSCNSVHKNKTHEEWKKSKKSDD